MNQPHAQKPFVAAPMTRRVSNISGKLVISGILFVAFIAAGTSWWFRYHATNQAVNFWGSESARLIRDAPVVELYRWGSVPTLAFQTGFFQRYLDRANGRDISNANGLTHLRNALLEDRSFRWPAKPSIPGSWGWVIVFRDGDGRAAVLLFASDWTYVSSFNRNLLSCEPIADGLAKMLGELAPSRDPRFENRDSQPPAYGSELGPSEESR